MNKRAITITSAALLVVTGCSSSTAGSPSTVAPASASGDSSRTPSASATPSRATSGSHLTGKPAFLRLLPTKAELSRALGGTWKLDGPNYTPPGGAYGEGSLAQQAGLSVVPDRCLLPAGAGLMSVPFSSSWESIWQDASQGSYSTVDTDIEAYQSRSLASAELGRWAAGLKQCPKFTAKQSGGGSLPFTVTGLRSSPAGVTFTMVLVGGGDVQPVVVRQVDTALIIVHGDSGGGGRALTLRAEGILAAVVASRVTAAT